jgi:hypothetical protein
MSQDGMYPLNSLYLFPVFQSRAEYFNVTGEQAPPWNPNKPVKTWFDPEARKTTRRTIIYDSALMYHENGALVVDPSGQPVLDTLALLKEEAGQVNMLPDEKMVDYGWGSKVAQIPVPLRKLNSNEELVITFGSVVAVRDKSAAIDTPVHFTTSDRLLLQKIAQKLGVS